MGQTARTTGGSGSSSTGASIAGIVLFPIAFPTLSTLGALAIDIAVLAAVLWFDWTPGDLPA